MSFFDINMHMNNVHLEWRVDLEVREHCVEALKCVNEAAINRIGLLHALAVCELMVGKLDQKNISEICPEYPGLENLAPVLKKNIDTLPPYVWFNTVNKQTQFSLPQEEINICNMCSDLALEEAILCPQCYGNGKFLAPSDWCSIKTSEILISKTLLQKIF